MPHPRAFASCARNGNYCRPKLVLDNVISIEAGRHPLSELVVDRFIPNDTHMGQDSSRVHIITGGWVTSPYHCEVRIIRAHASVGWAACASALREGTTWGGVHTWISL
jgi:hypothetical protein